MFFHSVEECNEYVQYRNMYPIATKVPMFKGEVDGKRLFEVHIADIVGKSFFHDTKRIIDNFSKIIDNYGKLNPIIKRLHIFMCPKPSASSSNAMATNEYIVLYARPTQIPWCMTDYIIGHEVGHVLQYELCPHRKNTNKFREYLELRNSPKGICEKYVGYDSEKDENIYEEVEDFIFLHGEQKERMRITDTWDLNPQEWFAEDFRYLFGVDRGDPYWGMPIPPPDDKIRDFLLSL